MLAHETRVSARWARRLATCGGVAAFEDGRMVKRIFVTALLLAFTWAASAADYKVGEKVEVKWGSSWYAAEVKAVEGPAQWKIGYDGYGANWDEVVGPDRIRARGAAAEVTAEATMKNAASAPTAAPVPAPPETFPWPERPAGAKGGLEGAYHRVQSWFFDGRVSFENEGWFFAKNGRVARTPRGGFDAKAFAAAKEARRTDGVYWLEGGKLFVKWANKPKVEEHKFARKGDDLEIGGLFAARVQGFKKGWRADASYEGGATAGGGGSFVASSNTLILRRDGTFTRSAMGSAIVATSADTFVGSAASEAAGSYEFDGHTLTLKHADGRTERFTVFGAFARNAAGAPDYLWRDGQMMKRSDAQ